MIKEEPAAPNLEVKGIQSKVQFVHLQGLTLSKTSSIEILMLKPVSQNLRKLINNEQNVIFALPKLFSASET